jgi:hypothetical protein
MHKLSDLNSYIISTKRPENVQRFASVPNCWWVIEESDVRSYKLYGAKNIIIAGGFRRGLAKIIDHANEVGQPYFKWDDDPKRVSLATYSDVKKKYVAEKITYTDAMSILLHTMQTHPDVKQVGIPPTANILNFQGKEFTKNKFCVNSLILFQPNTCRWRYPLKEDYQMSADIIKTYGYNLRCENILFEFEHWGNRGGCVDYRTAEMQMAAANDLVREYPEFMRHNTKKPGEVIFRYAGK